VSKKKGKKKRKREKKNDIEQEGRDDPTATWRSSGQVGLGHSPNFF